ncbi:DUF302 domain-containing protein [Limnochorda pilosa]|uniref:DUF302 domain-containing protein n=1 Tax=Limnochorda pilosa TaxID=1555112 RepID=A0A0K2SG73_LIMPI|nr:DUF302 domain-containing protein [Limnochorda pilosa]BAS26101.1 hypothetical protein LIP_0244 [Limnochorda pilosa]
MGARVYGFGKDLSLPYEQAVARLQERLREQGFGVLWEMDVPAILKEKLGVEMAGRYTILGACNPGLAHQALEKETEIGLLLPCNVVVYEHQGATRVAAVDPNAALGIVDNPELDPIASQAADRLRAAIDAV